MSVPDNQQEVPAPHRDWVGSNQIEAQAKRSLAKIAALWRPARTMLEPAVSTLSRYAHRLIDRRDGKAYSVDELETKILALTGAGTVEGLTTSDGTAAAAAGKLGEFMENSSNVGLANYTATSVASVTLTPGEWDVEGGLQIVGETASISLASVGINTSVAAPSSPHNINKTINSTAADSQDPIALPRRRFRVTTNTTVRVIAEVSFSAGTVTAYGTITARRAR